MNSLTGRGGIAGSLRFATAANAIMAAVLLGFGLISGMSLPYYAGLALICVCLVVQHFLARKQDPVSLNVAFFRINAVISVVFLVSVVVDVAWR